MMRSRSEVISSIRLEFNSWGIKTDDLTDDEIEEGARAIGKVFGGCGISISQAAEGMRRCMAVLDSDRVRD